MTSRSSSTAASTSTTGSTAPLSHIWASRNVEWPIPSQLSTANYQKLWRASQQTASQLGIATSSGAAGGSTRGALEPPPDAPYDSSSNFSEATGTPLKGKARAQLTPDTASAESTSYFTGFMNRVLNTSTVPSSGNDKTDLTPAMDAGGSRPLRPPRPHCVATANGWIVASLECPSPTAGILRLLSRWNVRRGSSADQWMALPPPLTEKGRVAHVFVDPTGCHTIVSANNGEAYYFHSSLRLPQKLLGFGPNADGSFSNTLTGIPATASSTKDVSSAGASSNTASNVQQGLSPRSYVTAVAWDRERGTEGSTKKILLGTSEGEIYEYALISPTSEDQDEAMAAPLLLHRLEIHRNSDELPATVTGLYLERLRTGLLILASTSGRNIPRTRLYTFYSPHNTSFRMALADQQHATLVDIPGAVDFADLRLCNDHFGLRTAMGIYYGTIDRSQSSNVLVTGGRSMIVDAGILPYEDVVQEGASIGSGGTAAISSLALTPHHMILLSDNSADAHHQKPPEVRFINRVAQKVIQKERMDLLTHHHGPVSTSSNQSNNPFASTPAAATALEDSTLWLGAGELLMDIRRPDQVWLRHGRSLIHISSTQEDRDVWKFTLARCLEKTALKSRSGSSYGAVPSLSRSISGAGPLLTEEEKAQEAMFEQAKNLCTNAAQKAVVTAIRAEYHLSQGRAELAAKYMAQCPPALAPFADTAIRLALPRLGIDDPQGYGHSAAAKVSLAASNVPLITYLSDKLRVAQMNQDRMTATMIGAWLTELYLHERGEQQQHEQSGGKKEDPLLSQFLHNLQNTDAKTIMRILASHDVSAADCASYAAQSGDIATAVNTALAVGSANPSVKLSLLCFVLPCLLSSNLDIHWLTNRPPLPP
jgi:Pep3/Vps18/deep orange family